MTVAYIFLIDNATYKDTFFGCSMSGCKNFLLKLMLGLRIKKCGISWQTLDMHYFVIMFVLTIT
jgi:hypothetical protein